MAGGPSGGIDAGAGRAGVAGSDPGADSSAWVLSGSSLATGVPLRRRCARSRATGEGHGWGDGAVGNRERETGILSASDAGAHQGEGQSADAARSYCSTAFARFRKLLRDALLSLPKYTAAEWFRVH